jgi:hypothetical protein
MAAKTPLVLLALALALGLAAAAPTCFTTEARPIPGIVGKASKADFWVLIDDVANTATWSMKMFSNYDVTMAHIHAGTCTATGLPVVGIFPAVSLGGVPPTLSTITPPFTIAGDMVMQSSFNSSLLSTSLQNQPMSALLAQANGGGLYFNIHNVANPNGVVCGNLVQANLNNCGVYYTP